MTPTIEDLIALINRTEPDHIQGLFDRKFDGSCPCFWGSKLIDGHRLYVHGTCWRVAKVGNQDLYVWGNFVKNDIRRVGEAIKRKLDRQEWYHEYTLITHKEGTRPFNRKRSRS